MKRRRSSFNCELPKNVLDCKLIYNGDNVFETNSYKLCCQSSYFQSVLSQSPLIKRLRRDSTGERISSKSADRTLHVEYDDEKSFKELLEYIHSFKQDRGTLDIKAEEALPLLRAAAHFGVDFLKIQCLKVIEKNLTFSSFFDCLNSLSLQLNNGIISTEIFVQYACKNCKQIRECKRLSEIPFKVFREMINDSMLDVDNEQEVDDMINEWCNKIQCSTEKLENINSTLSTKNNEIVYNQLKLDLANFASTRPLRQPTQLVLVFGGWEGIQEANFGPSNAIQLYNYKGSIWLKLSDFTSPMPEGTSYASCELYDNKVYILGGSLASGATQIVRSLNLETLLWKFEPPMHEKRDYVCSCQHNGYIYAIGGHNGRARLRSVERLNISQNVWEILEPMKSVRSDAGAAEVQGLIYVCGGFDGNRFLSSVEMFDPLTGQWQTVCEMLTIRSGLSVVSHNDSLYALGGNDGIQRLRTVERYDFINNKWITMPSMLRKRSNFCATILRESIIVMGGWSDDVGSTIASVEKWMPDTVAEWESISDLPSAISANCSCTVKDVNNIKIILNQL